MIICKCNDDAPDFFWRHSRPGDILLILRVTKDFTHYVNISNGYYSNKGGPDIVKYCTVQPGTITAELEEMLSVLYA